MGPSGVGGILFAENLCGSASAPVCLGTSSAGRRPQKARMRVSLLGNASGAHTMGTRALAGFPVTSERVVWPLLGASPRLHSAGSWPPPPAVPPTARAPTPTGGRGGLSRTSWPCRRLPPTLPWSRPCSRERVWNWFLGPVPAGFHRLWVVFGLQGPRSAVGSLVCFSRPGVLQPSGLARPLAPPSPGASKVV